MDASDLKALVVAAILQWKRQYNIRLPLERAMAADLAQKVLAEVAQEEAREVFRANNDAARAGMEKLGK